MAIRAGPAPEDQGELIILCPIGWKGNRVQRPGMCITEQSCTPGAQGTGFEAGGLNPLEFVSSKRVFFSSHRVFYWVLVPASPTPEMVGKMDPGSIAGGWMSSVCVFRSRRLFHEVLIHK